MSEDSNIVALTALHDLNETSSLTCDTIDIIRKRISEGQDIDLDHLDETLEFVREVISGQNEMLMKAMELHFNTNDALAGIKAALDKK